MTERLLVLGAGVSGKAAARLARRAEQSVTVYDQQPSAGLDLIAEGIGVVTGGWSSDLLHGVDRVVASPGFSERSLPVVETLEAGLPLWSEIEYAWRQLEIPIAAITGTNGKTTVTEAAAAMLAASDIETTAVGNIGSPLSDAVGRGHEGHRALVVEVSSFQLRFTESFRPSVGVLLNLAPDHLDWHGSFPSYVGAKQRIFANQTQQDPLIFDADDAGACAAVARAPSRLEPVSGRSRPPGGFGIAGGRMHFPGGSVAVEDLGVHDPVWLADLAAAAGAAAHLGANPEAISASAIAFRPGRHRRSVIDSFSGLTFVDDSKATNPHAALAAISAYPSVVLIAGGMAKGLDVRPVAAAPNLRHVVALGEAGPMLVEAARPGGATLVGSMEQAVEVALRVGRSGDTVLLAPACASFDMFPSYSARGDAFIAAVRARREGAA